ncbi:uncharacterized protein EDB93DRAFT_1331526 [Suillus bovinus]|uniref:uncharacterized protein n=1 Tax=Suillus bovinus TaxID=48563 RepID=UPI001B86247E|nr:uncharacterized protein EDB93DRAFT_1331526 [Suillus bovinus]KAG2133180.1 hypothetical protein EDB93DRAFT_1331526 [Suillus bovinus]
MLKDDHYSSEPTSRAPLASWSTSHPHANVLTGDAFSRGVIRSGTDYSVYEQAGLKGLDFAFYRGKEQGIIRIFGTIMIMFTFQTLRIANIVLLIVGPVILLMLVYFEHIIRVASRIRSGHYRAANGNLWVWFKFWTALLLGVAFQMLLVVGYVKLNSFVIHTHPWLVLVSALSLAYLTTALALTFPLTKHGVVPAPEQQKLSILLHQYVLTWAPLVYTTSAMTLGGTYFITVWNAVVFLGAVLACVEGMAGARGYKDEGEIQGQRCYVRGVHYDVVDTAENGHQRAGIIEETEPTEITRLVAQHGQSRPLGQEQGAIGWWIAQLLVVIPLPVILVSHIADIVLLATNQTLTDGTSPLSVYGPVSILALLILLPIAPFSMNMHRWLNETPLKVYFAQSVDLDTSRVVTTLTGPRQFLSTAIIPRFPSAFDQPINCTDAPDKLGLQTCTWEVGDAFVPSPGPSKRRYEPLQGRYLLVILGHWILVKTTSAQ